MAKIC